MTRMPSSGGRAVPAAATSVAPREAEDVFGDVVHDHLLGDRRDLHQPRLAPVALDVVLLGVPEPAVGLHRPVGGEGAGRGGEPLGEVALLAAWEAVVVAPRRFADHQLGAVTTCVCLG